MRSALESFGIRVNDYDALRLECVVSDAGTSIDIIEDTANRRGLRAHQVIVTVADVVDSSTSLPAIAIVDTPSGMDYWLLWRRDAKRILVMNPRLGSHWMSGDDVARALHIHEMDVPATPEVLALKVLVRRNGESAHLRGAIIVTLAR